MKSAAFCIASLLAACLGCNSILGIDAAQLEPADAGTDASSGVEVDSAPEAAECSLRSKDPCNTCVAQNCCAEYDACSSSPTCKAGLIKYAFCLGSNFTNDAGTSCDEDFLAIPGAEPTDLALCVFMNSCQEVCRDQTIGDLCITYCACMEDVCPEYTFDPDTCTDVCDNFDANNLVCRPYHCNLATQNRADETKRDLHCGHASGNAPCH